MGRGDRPGQGKSLFVFVSSRIFYCGPVGLSGRGLLSKIIQSDTVIAHQLQTEFSLLPDVFYPK
jgi:hypothetical protein